MPLPVFANTYVYDADDTIAAINPATDAGGDVALSNIINANSGPHTQTAGRTATSVAIGTGFTITLDSAQTVSCVAVLNVDDDPLGAEQLQVIGKDVAPATVFDTSSDLIRPAEVFSSHSFPSNPTRPCWIPGVDTLATPSATGTLATWSCKTLEVQLGTAFTSYLEAAYVALGTNGFQLQDEIQINQVKIDNVDLYAGHGYRIAISWPQLRKTDYEKLTAMWQRSERGNYPVFAFPHPGTKAADGTLAGEDQSPAFRGGLMRFLSLSGSGFAEYKNHHMTGVQATFESWQEVSTSG